MSLTDAQRAQIYEAYKTAHSEAVAELLMSTIPVFDWSDLATKSDIARLESELGRLESDLRWDVRADLDAFEARMQRNFIAILLGSQAAVAGLVGLFIGVAL